eukprot:351134-Chlamydomonas_euryale.AAC.5
MSSTSCHRKALPIPRMHAWKRARVCSAYGVHCAFFAGADSALPEHATVMQRHKKQPCACSRPPPQDPNQQHEDDEQQTA